MINQLNLPDVYDKDLSFIYSIRNEKKSLIDSSISIKSILPQIYVLSDLEWQIVKSLETYRFEDYVSEIINSNNLEAILKRILIIPDTLERIYTLIRLAEYFHAVEKFDLTKRIYSLASSFLLDSDLTDQAVTGWVENSNLIFGLICSMKTNDYAVDEDLFKRMLLFNDMEQERFGTGLYTQKHIEDEVKKRNWRKNPGNTFLELHGKFCKNLTSTQRSLKYYYKTEIHDYSFSLNLKKNNMSNSIFSPIRNPEIFLQRLDSINIVETPLIEVLGYLETLVNSTSSSIKRDLLSRYIRFDIGAPDDILLDIAVSFIIASLTKDDIYSISRHGIRTFIDVFRKNYNSVCLRVYLYRTKPQISPRFVFLLQLLIIDNFSQSPGFSSDVLQEIKYLIEKEFSFVTPTHIEGQYHLFSVIDPNCAKTSRSLSEQINEMYFS